MPPAVVMSPVTPPRSHGEPRPVSEPSSESPSENAMEIPAPIEAASPTRNASELCRVANAAANSGASVETEPSISPAKPGCTTCSKNRSEEHTSELQSRLHLVCRLLLEKKKKD